MEPVLGIVFHRRKIRLLQKKQEPYEHLPFYYQLAKKYQCPLFFYAWQDLLKQQHQRQGVPGYWYDWQQRRWRYRLSPLPAVNLFRAKMPAKKATIRQFYPLIKSEQPVFLNLPWDANKATVHQVLAQDPQLRPFLPWTLPLNLPNLQAGLRKFERLILKPLHGAKGEGILLFERRGEQIYQVRTKRGQRMGWRPIPSLDHGLRSGKREGEYLIQQFLTLQRYEGFPFDLRISVQKGEGHRWTITGRVLRVAAPHQYTTNVARGGRVLPFTTLRAQLDKVSLKRLDWLALTIAKRLEAWSPRVIDLGLDLALDQGGQPWFIEANFCDQRYAYREVGDWNTWFTTYAYPFGYAYTLMSQLKRERRMLQ